MKPYLLMLLLAIPPLISNILANAEQTDPAPAAEKTCPSAAKEIAPPALTPAPVAPSAPAPAPAKPAPTHGTGTSTGIKAWFIM